LKFDRIEQDVTWMEISTQPSALGIQPAQGFRVVSTGILPSKVAKSTRSQKSEIGINPKAEIAFTTRERRGEPFSAADLH